jgi:FPC/CPF motif-containing protein YcgG
MVMKGLYRDGTSHRYELHQWERNALEKFEVKMRNKDKPFPCIPATIGFSTNQIRYGFTGDPRETSTLDEFAALLKEYTEDSKDFGPYTSLVIFYETPKDLIETCTVEQFEQLFWEQLNGLTERDESEWPQQIPTDPHDPIWEFCYSGEQYFMYCASPAHRNRNSRHFDYFMLAITPRWVLKEFNKDQSYAEKIKSQIRKRLKNYDTMNIHPDLNTYGNNDNYEWKQYFLRDDETSLTKCPFHRLFKSKE